MVFANTIPPGEEHLHTNDSCCWCSPNIVFTSEGDMVFNHNRMVHHGHRDKKLKEDNLISHNPHTIVAIYVMAMGVSAVAGLCMAILGASWLSIATMLGYAFTLATGVIIGLWLTKK